MTSSRRKRESSPLSVMRIRTLCRLHGDRMRVASPKSLFDKCTSLGYKRTYNEYAEISIIAWVSPVRTNSADDPLSSVLPARTETLFASDHPTCRSRSGCRTTRIGAARSRWAPLEDTGGEPGLLPGEPCRPRVRGAARARAEDGRDRRSPSDVPPPAGRVDSACLPVRVSGPWRRASRERCRSHGDRRRPVLRRGLCHLSAAGDPWTRDQPHRLPTRRVPTKAGGRRPFLDASQRGPENRPHRRGE